MFTVKEAGYSATRVSALKPGGEEQRKALVNGCQCLTADEEPTLPIGVILGSDPCPFYTSSGALEEKLCWKTPLSHPRMQTELTEMVRSFMILALSNFTSDNRTTFFFFEAKDL